ncbi:aminodeoxychorismate synthase component I [Legionella fairfieldensis]|uniref:aminodeoxychorismate synthase component I n=1 Tax=Legionella fairfieldensis TaxID=45064 RepID=UPI00048E2038|nr:aminodeoxychorismate synthase component I [Legionella fairfieldensis]
MSKFSVFNLNYNQNLLNNYQNLAKLPGFVLLESSDKTVGRYDILSAFPYEKIILPRESDHKQQVFKHLQQLLPRKKSVIDLPFQGGAIGYFSYDLATWLAGVASSPQTNLQDMPLVDIGMYDWAIITDHHLQQVCLFAANDRLETAEISKEILARWEETNKEFDFFTVEKPFSPMLSKSEYQDAFYSIHQDLKRGRAYQVNYTQSFNAPYRGDAWVIYKKIRMNNPVPYAAFLRTDEADILGFSPERFLMMEKNYLLTSPIKGTEKRSSNPQLDNQLREKLVRSAKNRAENVMIVDLLRNDLGKIAQPGSVQVRALCEVESYQSVHHLVSHIEALCLESKFPLDVFQACFPGGSITGAPKLESMRIIAEQEQHGRGIYCGAIGYFSQHGRFDTNVAIRTLTARNGVLHLAAGGGIVIDSDWEDEYLECFTKIAAITNGLQ